ncbi:MAG: YdiU family protein, partial [Pseudomonadota bacterium]
MDLALNEAAIPFDNSFAKLPDKFYRRVNPTEVKAPEIIRVNDDLARFLNIDPEFLRSNTGLAILAGNSIPDGAEPIAMAYAGHQFGHFVPQLGDGRALLLGEVVAKDGSRHDIQLKGSGPTPFSRMGDGRAALGPVLREYVVSEAMAALGVPTTRALAAVTTGEPVFRSWAQPGAVFTRVARSHIRVGTFQFFAAREDVEGVRSLADYAISRLYPEITEDPNPYEALLKVVIQKQARLISRWMGLGFIHGVMNTDNTAIAAETIDYGPCAFIDTYDPATVYSSVDHMGRYAFANQPTIGQWNLAKFAQCLLPLLDEDAEEALGRGQAAIDAYPKQFETALTQELAKKLGFAQPKVAHLELAHDLLKRMAENEADFTNTFNRLASLLEADFNPNSGPRLLFKSPERFDDWVLSWRDAISAESQGASETLEILQQANPVVIPRNHLVEEAIRAAEDDGDFSVFEMLLKVVCRPFDRSMLESRFAMPPTPDEV